MELSGHCDVLVLVGPGQGPGPSESCGTLMLRRAPVGGSSPGTCCRNPEGYLNVAVGSARSPGRARVLALGCCAGPLERVVAGNILSEVTALSGRAEPRWVLAGGQQVPSESVARRSRHVRQVEWRVGPVCRADCGQ
jgi:hypothetical protein